MALEFDVICPKDHNELLKVIADNQENHFRFCAGGTDLLIEQKKQPETDLIVINLGSMADDPFGSIAKTDDGYRIGAMVTAAQVLDNKELCTAYPVLQKAASELASRQIRQVATIGGNLCTASPSGDMACALMALKVQLEIVNADSTERSVGIKEFFTGVRQTVLRKNEVLKSILIPLNGADKLHSGFIKVGTRASMECSVVSLAYHIQVDEAKKVKDAGIAIGSVAPVIKFCNSACDLIIGMGVPDEQMCNEFAEQVMNYASPISDVRASAWYRKEVLYNISRSILEEWIQDR